MPGLVSFDTVQPRAGKANVLLPTSLDHPYQVQRLVELVTEVALYEGRYAGDVLTDMLGQPTAAGTGNGPAGATETSAAVRR